MYMTKPKLSVIILNYNTKELLSDCLKSVKEYMNEVPMEVIVSDNSSNDGSQEMIKKNFPWVKFIEGPNEGFSKGNNRAKSLVEGEMVLFLNPDTIVHKDVFVKTVRYLDEHPKVGAVTCKLVLPNGDMDKDVRRRFPVPWVSFQKLVLGKSKYYYYEDIPDNATHEVEAIQGAFFLTYKKLLDKVGWFDERYFFDGEDVDLCFQINKAGYSLVYYPDVYITHLKGVTKGKVKKWRHKLTDQQRKRIRMAGVASMELFYRKNLWKKYPVWFSYFVLLGINLYKVIRFVRVVLLSSY
ncbi:MAG: Glycosyl transferase family 2 [Candidatus Woesebacteria bacterium GW2011_GWA1_33_30]|uniref:Glycosyl transferase family 2 n=1 Tax=Candidatus Woesebacteria bacterium GW2011_GWA2_33_28 TaxID=1618561 RepID=A0A0F9ZVX3_9BACT|nr:MAG: Glycosyl transferase family 2 [Candidatus Woesebacteria bacterium GW2011_GWA2_33_28]KKP49126.1 MAG: Glycosyl transferase family 2 [Candidatus Woesebacteria bacterium GW2011_GWA1_33_30]KKP50274.1 MAG: Glycosyl transferase family 2 [Microgenomates group bacterium GW2011_GWC1_33_32]KKP52717.1 MAG: Glycosyl transferase family 2 [Candidatus Woesebacteria bacterium GW2011_GWB1_33_38]